LYFIGVEFLPGMTVMADPKNFHGSAAILNWYSNFVQTPWFWLIVGFFVTVNIIIIKTLPNAYGSDRFRVYLDNVPAWSIYRLLVGSNFMLALGALLKAGVKLDDALTQIKKYSPPYLALRINALQKEIRSGRNFGEALEATGYQFPSQEIIDDMGIYSALPQFDQILFEYGKQWIKDGTEAVKLQVAIFSGVALLIMSMAMALLVDGVSQIEQQMGETIQQINY
jgi:type II secretory pathway component PulF